MAKERVVLTDPAKADAEVILVLRIIDTRSNPAENPFDQ